MPKPKTLDQPPRPLGRKILPRGPKNADIMMIGEAGGYHEEQAGRVFVGPTGIEMGRLLKQAGIAIRDLYLTNVVKYRPYTNKRGGNVQPSKSEIDRDTPELVREIERVGPFFIGAVGAVAARWLLGSTFTGIEETRGLAFPSANWRAAAAEDVRATHDEEVSVRMRSMVRGEAGAALAGRDARADVCGVASDRLSGVAHFIVVVLTHPAAGFHDTDAQEDIYRDFMAFGRYIRGELPIEQVRDEHPDPDYYEPHSVSLISGLPVAIDTEGLRPRPWGLSYAQVPGSAGVIRAYARA